MTLTEEKLTCAKCGTEHNALPEMRTDTWNGIEQTGVWAKDFTYYRDFYLSKGYVVLCNTHKIETISRHTESASKIDGL